LNSEHNNVGHMFRVWMQFKPITQFTAMHIVEMQ